MALEVDITKKLDGFFIAETDQGQGARFPHWLKPYLQYILPCVLVFLFIQGYVDKFMK